MKKIVVLLVVIAAALLAYNYLTTGELRLLPAASSPQAKELASLERELQRTMVDYQTAAKGAALSGVDFTAEATAARRSARSIEKRLEALEKSIDSGKDRERAARLREKVEAFLESLE